MYPLPSVGLEDDGGVAGVLVVGLRVVEGERREDDADADLEPLVDREVGVVPVGQVVEERPGRGLEGLLLERNGRIAKARGELQRVDTGVVDDTVQVDAADVPLVGEPPL